MPRKGALRIGTSGYQYKHWKGLFYPEGLRQKDWFSYYAEQFDTVEINNSFYRLPEAETFDAWREAAPKNFLYAVKYSRYGSHMKKLKEPEEHVALFIERAKRLRGTLGPILVQLPPGWNVNVERLDAFLQAAPKQYRWTIEFRNETWLRDDVFEILRAHKAALCIHDRLPDHPWERTTDWYYIRYHGGPNDGDYPHQTLCAHAKRIERYRKNGHDVYVYFNNDWHGYALKNARQLLRYTS